MILSVLDLEILRSARNDILRQSIDNLCTQRATNGRPYRFV